MGQKIGKLPPLHDRDHKTLLSYNLENSHVKRLWQKFIEVDGDFNGVWTIKECYAVIQEPRLSIRAPIIDALFFMADGNSDGSLVFQDYLVAFSSFCALSREEMLQLLFIIIDTDRDGRVDKEELLDFFSYVPVGAGEHTGPLFPVNNKNALDRFRAGRWSSLEFDGLAQLCERFPYISYPAYHVQDQYRKHFIGKKFWERLDTDRIKYHSKKTQPKKVVLPGTNMYVELKPPGRCTMAELLEYSRRKTSVQCGKRVADAKKEAASFITKLRDQEIARSPLLAMIRNPRCMYHIPSVDETVDHMLAMRPKPAEAQNEFQLEVESSAVPAGLALAGRPPSESSESAESSSDDGSEDSNVPCRAKLGNGTPATSKTPASSKTPALGNGPQHLALGNAGSRGNSSEPQPALGNGRQPALPPPPQHAVMRTQGQPALPPPPARTPPMALNPHVEVREKEHETFAAQQAAAPLPLPGVGRSP